MNWKNFYEFQDKWCLQNRIIRTIKSIDTSQSFPTIGHVTMGGIGYKEHKNIANLIIPADKIGYLQRSNAGSEGTLVVFDFAISPEQVTRKSFTVIRQQIDAGSRKTSVMLSAKDMAGLQVFLND